MAAMCLPVSRPGIEMMILDISGELLLSLCRPREKIKRSGTFLEHIYIIMSNHEGGSEGERERERERGRESRNRSL